MMLRARALLLAAVFVAAKSQGACESGEGACEEVKSAALLQQRREEIKVGVEGGAEHESKQDESKSTTTTFTMIGNISSVKVADLDKDDSEVDFELKDGAHLTFKQDNGSKQVHSKDSFVGDSTDGKTHVDLVKQLKPGCSTNSTGASCYDLFASIVNESSGKVYHISPNANDELEVTETDTNDYPEEAPPHESPGMVGLLQEQEDDELAKQDSIIDVLIVWTDKAECSNSKLPSGCSHTAQTEVNMRGLLNLAIEETNTAFEKSGVNADLRLVHAYRDTSGYDEQAGFSPALNAITNTADGVMDDVHSKRQQYGADVVVLIISHSQYCGLAWLGPSKSRMFSVTSYGCATGYYSFGHEIAHNMGCNHDKGTSQACSNSGSNYGYRDPQGQFRSIMGYNCRAGQCDNNVNGGCTRVQRFSNPTFLYNGKPIGDAAHDNARQLNKVRATVAAYFTSGATTTSTTPTRPPAPTLPPMTTAAPKPMTTAAPNPVTTAAPKSGPGIVACDFENGLCGWTSDRNVRGVEVWQTGSKTPSGLTGPQKGDHSPQGDKFAFFESSSPNFGGKTFNLTSRSFDSPSPFTFAFWYNMYGQTMGTIILESYDGATWTKQWEMSGNKKDIWFEASVAIPAGTAVLRFSGTTRTSWTSDFALDDMSVSLAPTTLPPATQAPTTLPPTTQAPTTLPPTTQAPTTLPPTTQPPTSLPPTTQPPVPATTTSTVDEVVIPIVVNASETDKMEIHVSIVK